MPVELGFTVILALKKTFRLLNEPSEPDKDLWKLSELYTLQDRLEFIFKKIKLKENRYSYRYDYEYEKEDWEYMYGVDISGLEDEYYIMIREGVYDKADYEGDPDTKYDDHLYDSVYKRFGNVDRRINLFEDNLILVHCYFEGGFPKER